MGKPRFTFCIPNLNKRKFLPACIESVLAQDCGDWRCVFVDGYSTDGSWEYMQQFASDSRFLLLRGRKQGMYADWNECLQNVDTEYFYFLTSDDTCSPQLVSKTTAVLDVYSDIDVCHFQCDLIDENGEVLSKTDDLFGSDFIYREANQYAHQRSGVCDFFMHFVYRAIYVTITSLVFRKSLIKNLEEFRTSFGTFGDYDWTMRMCLFTDILYIPDTLATWRNYTGQATKSVSYLQYHDWALSVTNLNLNCFIDSDIAQTLKNRLDTQQLLSEFHINYSSCLFEEIFNFNSISDFIKYANLLLSKYPFYVPKKIFHYLTLKKFYCRPKNHEFAKRNISYYGLNWPPEKVDSSLLKGRLELKY